MKTQISCRAFFSSPSWQTSSLDSPPEKNCANVEAEKYDQEMQNVLQLNQHAHQQTLSWGPQSCQRGKFCVAGPSLLTWFEPVQPRFWLKYFLAFSCTTAFHASQTWTFQLVHSHGLWWLCGHSTYFRSENLDCFMPVTMKIMFLVFTHDAQLGFSMKRWYRWLSVTPSTQLGTT